MPIVVPSTRSRATSPSFPVIAEEFFPTLHIMGLLGSLGEYEHRFWLALQLFENALAEKADLARQVEFGALDLGTLDLKTNTLLGWRKMAARDGALAIYHFGQALDAIGSSLKECPTVRACTDHTKLRLVRTQFHAHFPSAHSIRHVIGHHADIGAAIEWSAKHSVRGPYQATFGGTAIRILDHAHIVFCDNLYDHTYVVTYDGAVHSYQITAETSDTISKIRQKTYSAFDEAVAS